MLNDYVNDVKMLIIGTKSQIKVEDTMFNFHSKWKLSKTKHRIVRNEEMEL